MLKLAFTVSFGEDMKVNGIYRNCNVPRPTCEGCKFKKLCDKVEKEFIYAVFSNRENSYEEVDILGERIKRELLEEEIEKIKKKFDTEEIPAAVEWLLTESTIAYAVDYTISKIKQYFELQEKKEGQE